MTKKKLTIKKRKGIEQSVSHSEYVKFIAHLKEKIRSSQVKAAVSVNRELIRLYWEIGKDITQKQEKEGWGTKIVETVSRDLQNEFPGIEGFSPRNIWRMAAFYKAYAILPQLVAELGRNGLPECLETVPWGHNAVLLEKLKSPEERIWYAQMTIAEGWSREGLLDAIKSSTYKRHGKAVTNFHERLPAPHSKLAHDTLKDPYNFDFKPEFAGKMNFYLSAVDDLLKHPSDNPTIGLLICKRKDNFIAEYALRDINKPMGVAEYEAKISKGLLKKLKSSLPTVEEIEAELSTAKAVEISAPEKTKKKKT